MKNTVRILFSILLITFFAYTFCQDKIFTGKTEGRQRLLMDFGWRFALGHAYDTDKDFNHGTGYFSYFTKTGYGDGPAAGDFDDDIPF